MKVNPVAMLYLAAGAAGVFVAWRLWGVATAGAGKAAEVAQQVITRDLNPASSDNIVNRGVSAAGEAITGQKDWSLGSWLYDVFNPDPLASPSSNQRATIGLVTPPVYLQPPSWASFNDQVQHDPYAPWTYTP